MIDLKTVWVPQILGYCEMIADDQKLASVFNQNPNDVWTSVTSYDELVEQIFEDLESKGQLDSLMESDIPAGLKIEVKNFIDLFDCFDRELENGQPDFASTQWKQVGAAARSVIVASEGWNNH